MNVKGLNMGSISHPLNLVILFMVTTVAAKVHIVDDTDIGSVTGNRPKSRGDDSNELQHTARDSIADIKSLKRLRIHANENDAYEGNFYIRINVMPYNNAGTSDKIFLLVEFASRDTWGNFEYIHNNFWSGDDYEFIKNKTYYGNSDRVINVFVYNHGTDAFFPDMIIINGPEECDRHECDWWSKCRVVYGSGIWQVIDYRACFVQQGYIVIPCKRANANPKCP